MAIKVWHLPREVELTYAVNSWRVRETPSLIARTLYHLHPGEEFLVKCQHGNWLQVLYGKDDCEGWIYPKLNDVPGRSGEVQVLVPVEQDADTPGQCAEDFQPASSYDGTRPGYAFKMGDSGL